MTGISITQDLIMHKVKIFQAGALLVAEPNNAIKHSLCPHTEFTEHKKNQKRGNIQGFSRRSCGRLRKALIRYDFSHCITMALTAPPYAPNSPESVLEWMCNHHARLGDDVAIVWRKEVTKIGTVHYHLIVWSSDLKGAFERIVSVWSNGLFPKDFDYLSIKDALYDSIIRYPKNKFYSHAMYLCILEQLALGNTRLNPNQVERVPYKDLCEYCRSKVREVNLHQDTNYQEVGINYIKYILDHTSKHKDYQAKTTGRAWGIINRSAIPLSSYTDTELSPRQYDIFLRVLGKMCRVKDTRDRNKLKPFGYKLSRRKHYNCARIWGKSPQFLAPSSLKRALDYAKQC